MDVALEVGPTRRVFAHAVDWCGFSRAGKDEGSAVDALLHAGPRYALIAGAAGVGFTPGSSAADVRITERTDGNATSDFGALAVLLARDLEPLDAKGRDQIVALLTASWDAFDRSYSALPKKAREARPSTGRSASAMRAHIVDADAMHAAAFGIPYRKLDPAALESTLPTVRGQILEGLARTALNQRIDPLRKYGFDWTPRFAARRSAWHALDHAWELDDRP
jgi:hypothetical protein